LPPRHHDRWITIVRTDSAQTEQNRAGLRLAAWSAWRGRLRRSRRPPLTLVTIADPWEPAAPPEPSGPPPGPGSGRRAGGHRRRRAPGRAAWLAVVPVGIGAVVLTVVAFSGSHPATRTAPPAAPPAPAVPPVPRAGAAAGSPLVVASLPYWSLSQGTATVLASRPDVNEVSPWLYGVAGDGRIVLDSGISQAMLATSLNQLRAQGLPLVPTIANVDDQGNFTYPAVGRILHDPALVARHVADIVALVSAQHYGGIDIDYEDLQAGDRQDFTSFITQLAAALHARGKILSVALFAKATDSGYAPRNVAQDYAAIGKVADQVRLMGYDYHWATSPPGPIAPVSWLKNVLRYARTQIPAAKIILGVPEYGYDWSGGLGTGISWQRAVQLSRKPGVQVHYNSASQAPWFSYTDAVGRQHIVWFENTRSSQAKFRLARAAGIGGVYLWLYGSADPGTWSALRQVLPIGPQIPVPSVRSSS
jgi:spore germination protein